jgi:hypothetical protein
MMEQILMVMIKLFFRVKFFQSIRNFELGTYPRSLISICSFNAT